MEYICLIDPTGGVVEWDICGFTVYPAGLGPIWDWLHLTTWQPTVTISPDKIEQLPQFLCLRAQNQKDHMGDISQSAD